MYHVAKKGIYECATSIRMFALCKSKSHISQEQCALLIITTVPFLFRTPLPSPPPQRINKERKKKEHRNSMLATFLKFCVRFDQLPLSIHRKFRFT